MHKLLKYASALALGLILVTLPVSAKISESYQASDGSTCADFDNPSDINNVYDQTIDLLSEYDGPNKVEILSTSIDRENGEGVLVVQTIVPSRGVVIQDINKWADGTWCKVQRLRSVQPSDNAGEDS